MLEFRKALSFQETRIQLTKEMLVSFHTLEDAVVSVESHGITDYGMPIRRFNQLVESVKAIHDFSRQKHKPWVFSVFPVDKEGEGLQYVIDLRTKAISVAENTKRGFRNIRSADITEISDYLLPVAMVLIKSVRGRTPYELERKMSQYEGIKKVIGEVEREILKPKK